MEHIPVLLDEVVRALKPKVGEIYVDATFGAGGYSRAFLQAADCTVIGLDRDPNVRPDADKFTAEFGSRFRFEHIAFSNMETVAPAGEVDGVVLDIGVSSMQLDQSERGFSFQNSGPLDMRMSGVGPNAMDAVNSLKDKELRDIFKVYGEERRAKKCADFIVRSREVAPIETTEDLANVISDALGRSGKKHPATKVFQALRIYINDELSELEKALLAAEKILAPGGRLVVVSFHSLEDRIVKSFLRKRAGETLGGSRHMPPVKHEQRPPSFILAKRSSLSPGAQEQSRNPRSRSARLRVAVRTQASAWEDESLQNDMLPNVPDLAQLAEMVS